MLRLEPEGQRKSHGIVAQGVSASGLDEQARKECIERLSTPSMRCKRQLGRLRVASGIMG